MISVNEAVDIALNQSSILGTDTISILEAKGHILAEDIYSDIDMPPFDKSAMDGYALKCGDVKNVPTILEVVGMIPAGVYPEFVIKSGCAAKIMTGAPLPGGADGVQMVEKTVALDNGSVKILESVSPEMHVAKKGEIIRTNDKVITRGSYISSAMVGVLATVGREQVRIFKPPQVGILVTGDELVEVSRKPEPGQIRNSNGYVLYNQVRECGASPELFSIASDNVEELSKKIDSGLKNDVLLISGGMSMGELDFVKDICEKLGVQIYYNKVNIKPGKPTLFGRRNNSLVFGLPGNPVSASTVFEIIVRPAIRKIMGFRQFHNLKVKAKIDRYFVSSTKRESCLSARTFLVNNEFFTSPLPSKGSADFMAFANSNSFIHIPGEVNEYKKGQAVDVTLRDEFEATCLDQ